MLVSSVLLALIFTHAHWRAIKACHLIFIFNFLCQQIEQVALAHVTRTRRLHRRRIIHSSSPFTASSQARARKGKIKLAQDAHGCALVAHNEIVYFTSRRRRRCRRLPNQIFVVVFHEGRLTSPGQQSKCSLRQLCVCACMSVCLWPVIMLTRWPA